MNTRIRTLGIVVGAAFAMSAHADGVVVLDLEGFADVLYALDVAADGKIFAEVSPDQFQTCGYFGLDPDGRLLTNYGVGGRLDRGTCARAIRASADGGMQALTLPGLEMRDSSGALVSRVSTLFTPSVQQAFGTAIARQPDGKTVIGAQVSQCRVCNDYDWAFSRLNADGSLDTTFGTNGSVVVTVNGRGAARVSSIHVFADGKIVATGATDLRTSPPTGTLAVRLSSAGALDFTFGANGRVTLGAGPGFSAVDSQGRIYVVESANGVRRILSDGALDSTYSTASVALTDLSALEVDASDRIVMFGRVANHGAITRLDTSGAPDVSFNGNGEVLHDFPYGVLVSTSQPSCNGGLQPPNSLLLACAIGSEGDGTSAGQPNLAIARFTDAGSLDVAFGSQQQDADTYPDALTIMPASAPYGAAHVFSAPVTVTGINGRTFVQGSDYSIGCTGQIFSGASSITSGETLCVRLDASTVAGAVRSSTLNVGGRTAVFTLTATNSPADSIPDAFGFASRTDVALGAVVSSSAITVQGLEGYTTVSIVNGEYDFGCDGGFATGTISDVANGTSICVRHTASANASTTVTTTLTIGGVSGTFSSTTIAPPPPPPPPAASGGGGKSGGGRLDIILIFFLVSLAGLSAYRRRTSRSV